ncbi:MAG: hypothetical protein P8Q98_03700 [Candidatus Poseidoniaceae archaeon]|nr:hypothetical protein [Candidatus Poseidoniaceae archaeon]
MTHENRNLRAPLFLVALMVLAPFAGAANVTTFANQDSEADIEMRDGTAFLNRDDGSIDLPSGDTVTSASMDLSVNMIEHAAHQRIDTDTMSRVWNPNYNNQLTKFSNESHFTYEDGATATPVSLTAEGLLTDFEETQADFADQRDFYQNSFGFDHGEIGGTSGPAPPGVPDCYSGSYCWGTGLNDNDYTNEFYNQGNNNGKSYALRSPSMYIDLALKDTTAYFDSYHDLDRITPSGTNPAIKYTDCAYVQIRTSSSGVFPPDPTGFQYIDIDIGNSSGVGYSNGYYRVSTGSNNAGEIYSQCNGDGINGNDYALGGTSVSTGNPTGWGNIAIDLIQYVGQYIQLQFVLEDNDISGSDGGAAGWYIDNFRLGDVLPQTATMDINGFLPSVQSGENQPNGYGILTIESETTSSATLSLEVMDSATGQTVVDNHGNPMVGLQGKIIELWEINSTEYPSVNFRLSFDSGSSRLSSPVFHGFSIGTRVGTGFNQTDDMTTGVINGVWEAEGGMPMVYSPTLNDVSYTPELERSSFSKPITRITAHVQDDCTEVPTIDLQGYGGDGLIGMIPDTEYTLDSPIFGFETLMSYQNNCNVGGIWFDLHFGHHADNFQVDIANDSNIDWGFDEPAFGSFGRQTNFLLNKVNGINYGTDAANISTDLTGVAEGGNFMLPKGAVVRSTDFVLDEVTIRSSTDPTEGFNFSVLSGTQEVSLGAIGNVSRVLPEYLEATDLTAALNSLLTNPLVPVSHIDAYGNEWMTFRFKAESPSSETGATMVIRDIDVVYNLTTTLDNSDGLDLELNKGVALWDGGSMANVEIAVTSTSGGGLTLSNLAIVTASGYDNTLSVTGNPVGFYPNGELYEIVTTHTVAASTTSNLVESFLTLESSTGTVILSYSDAIGFAEASDVNDLITLESTSTQSDITDGKQITWRFIVNSNWEDTDEVRIYAGLLAGNGVNGLPSAVLMAPVGGNAVENDAVITAFEVRNDIGLSQDLDNGKSNQIVNIAGSIRLENLDISPDPSRYYMVLEQKTINTSDENFSVEWISIENQSGVIGGDFDLNIDLGFAAGEETYRFRIDGYEGGDTLCPASIYRPDSECAIPFNLSIDTLDPSLIEVKILNGQVDPSLESNWRTMVDDTWVVPSANQQIRLNAYDLPNPPASLDIKIWVENDHDANSDGLADASEYITVTVNNDGQAPFANYTGSFSDMANIGADPVGKVSIWIEGYDLAGNPIDGGAPGFENDHFTYVSMSSKSPVIRNFFIDDSRDGRFLNSNQPQYDGKWNQTMYAGNQYSLVVEANDDNGWRDVSYFHVDLADDRDDMNVYYYPRNGTAWTDSPWITILEESDISDGPQMLRMDGGALIDPFEADFILDLPIRIDWGVLGATTALNNPVLYMQDLDNPRYRMLPAPGRHIQDWYYSDGIQLDFRTDEVNNLMVTPVFEDLSEPQTEDVRKGFVYPGDTISFQGQYAYLDGINNNVFITPEIPLTLEITRSNALADGAKGYVPFPGEVTYHTFTGGVFDINLTAAPVANDYQYSFRLCPFDDPTTALDDATSCGAEETGLPDGAVDSTPAVCAGSSSYGCSTFNIRVDGNPPEVNTDSWTAKRGATGEVISGDMPTSTYHCVDVEVVLKEREALFQGDVSVAWAFYSDSSNNIVWPLYRTSFGDEAMTAELTLAPLGGSYAASATCIDLWPLEEGQLEPAEDQISNVELVMWIEAKDSAGAAVIFGGGPTEEGGVAAIFSSSEEHKSTYRFIHEEPSFAVENTILTPSSPEVGDKMKLQIEVRNDGTMAGGTTLSVRSVTAGGIPVLEGTVETGDIDILDKKWVTIDLIEFSQATTGMYYLISDETTNELLYNGSAEGEQFNVKVQSESSDGTTVLLILVALVTVVVILGIVVLVLVRRDSDDGMFEDGYDEDDAPAKAYVELPGQSTSAPAANVTPEMAAAMQKFPQWNQEEIQGYFDQGWSIEALEDWVNNQ